MDKLQRYRIRRDGVIEAVDTGGWLQWPDVDALLARIREAVATFDNAWRVLAEGEHLVDVCDDDAAELADRQAEDDIDDARATLDALLSLGRRRG